MVEIIPKRIAKETTLKNIYFFIAGSLLLAVVFGYVILIRSQAAALLKMQDLEAGIIKIGTREDRNIERKVFESEDKIKTYKNLSSARNKSAEFFNNFESLTHPQVWFSSFDFNPAEIKAAASGKTVNFKTLEQQVVFLKSQKDLIKSLDLSKVSLGKNGEVDFYLTVNFTPKILEASK
ncbi:MAG: hypothetical protein HYT20_00955 [Candidatus Nealsonbacteria bacterium]|nr:hypothetical protein [Candidatus Nealsonbacteria bacterium]